jgi:hypothetical protein
MRYWAYFAAKIAVAAGVFRGLLALLNWAYPPQQAYIHGYRWIPPRLGYDLSFTMWSLLVFVMAAATVKFIILDQQHRCRVCLRRLRMPVETGSWSRMLQLGRPRIEYICPYGHGTLKEDELQISGLQEPEWTPHSGDIWEELTASSKESDDRP